MHDKACVTAYTCIAAYILSNKHLKNLDYFYAPKLVELKIRWKRECNRELSNVCNNIALLDSFRMLVLTSTKILFKNAI